MSDKKHRVTEYTSTTFSSIVGRGAHTPARRSTTRLCSARLKPHAGRHLPTTPQPWRFIYVKNGSEYWDPLLKAANERNQRWAAKAGVLIVLISKKTQIRPDETEPTPLRNHSSRCRCGLAEPGTSGEL